MRSKMAVHNDWKPEIVRARQITCLWLYKSSGLQNATVRVELKRCLETVTEKQCCEKYCKTSLFQLSSCFSCSHLQALFYLALILLEHIW